MMLQVIVGQMSHGFPPCETFPCDYRAVTQHCQGCTLPVPQNARTRIYCHASAPGASLRICAILRLPIRGRSTRRWHGSSRAGDCGRSASCQQLSCNAKLLLATSCLGWAALGGMNCTRECWGAQWKFHQFGDNCRVTLCSCWCIWE
jgi:hypothetical protein